MDGSEKLVIACVTAPLLLHKLQNLTNHELKVPVREAIVELEMVSTRLRDAEKIPTNLDIPDRIREEFLEVLNDLEDVIIYEFFGSINKQRRRNESLKIMSPLICLRPRVRMDLISYNLSLFTTTAKKVFKELENLGRTTGGTTSSPPQPMRTRNLDYPMPDDSDFVGLNDKVDEVVKRLCYGKMPNYTIAVTGEAGSGKTFLTRTVYNTPEVKRHFHGRAWVNFIEYFEAREFLLNILTQLTWWDWEFLDENLSHDELKLKLQNFSDKNRCLIVVDDVRTVEGFYRLYNECGLSSKGIWLILTISKKDVELASLKVKPHFCHLIRLRSLTDEESWTLFCKKAQIAKEKEINLKENILRNCGGSPREILIMEGLLSTTKWPSSVIELKIQKDILNLCYQDLSSQMKVCFLYLGLFPSAFEIPVRRLFHLWVAERLFITLPEENMALEDLAEDCLKLLIRRNLIEVTKVRLDGSPKTCRMPVTIWDVFSRRATTLFLRESNIRPRKDYIRSYALNSWTPKSINKLHDAPARESRSFGLLVVLDLENVYKPVLLSETLGKLLHLKHLGLRRTFLDSLPRSVGNLPFLETLDVKHTNITTLPSSIWKAKNLQHLYLNENNFDMSSEKLYIIRSELQTLSGLFVGNKSVPWSKLYTLLRLRKLKLTFYSKFADGIGEWISELNGLRSLKLRSIDEFGRPSTLEFGFLERQHKLLELYLVGPLTRSIESLNSPNLKVLTLSASKLEKDPMPVLGKLRHLNCLRLFRNSYLGKDMTCSAEEFPQLRVLKLWALENLEKWTVMEGTMPLLRELEIRLCPKLKLPEKLTLTLKDVVLINMPDGFVEHVERLLVNSFVKKITLPFAALLAKAKVSDELIARTAACVLAAAPMPDKD